MDRTKDKLIRAAERLMAERGVDAVTFAEITQAAGQRNNSAVPYYFGDRHGIIRAVLEKHRADVAARRDALMDELPNFPPLRDVVCALVIPIVEQVEHAEGGGDYVRIVAHLLGHPELKPTALGIGLTPMNRRLDRAMLHATSGLSPVLLGIRMDFVLSVLFHGLADHVRSLVDPPTDVVRRQVYVENLIDTIEAILAATPSPATVDLLDAHPPTRDEQ